MEIAFTQHLQMISFVFRFVLEEISTRIWLRSFGKIGNAIKEVN